MSFFEDALVIVDGAREDPGGGLQQVPDPGVTRAWVGDQSPSLETVCHQEPGPVASTLRISRPEIIFLPIFPLEGQIVFLITGIFLN